LRATAVRSELTSLVGQELVRRRVPGAPIEIPPFKIEIEPSEADELSIAVIPAPANEQWNMAPLLSRLRRDRASAALGQGSAVRVRHPLDRHPKWGRLFTAAHSWADALPAERKDETFLGAAEVLDRWHARPTVHRDGRPSRGQEDYLELRTRMTELIAYQLGLDGYVVTAETLAQELQLDFGPRRVSDGPALTAEIGFVVGETTLPESETRRLQEFARNLAEHISSQGARSDPSGLPHAVVHIEGGRSELGSPGPDEARERRVRMARDLVRRTVNARLLELGASASLLSSFVSYDVSAPWRGSPGQSSPATTTGQQPHQVRIWTSVPRPPWEVLGALAGPVEDGAPMRVAPHPADEETAARRGVQLVEATQRMVPGARDLEVARWLLAEDPVQAAGSSQWVRTGLGEDLMRSSSASQEALRKTLRQQVDRIDDDLHLFITMWERSPQVWRTLRPVQAAALVVIGRRGREVHDHAHEAARRRFEGTEWGRLYSGLDINELLRTVHEHLRKGMKLVTNVSDDRLDSLLADPEGRFRNYWETGTTEGADDSEARRIAESAMGYTASLQGTLDGHARPTAQDARDLPKYAALLPRRRPGGLSGYGNIALHWKQEVRARSSFVPDDSLDYGSVSGVREITGPDNLYPLLAYGADGLARLAFAEATGFAYDSELAQMLADERTEAVAGFFEAQIHGDLSWSDVEQVVILYDEEFVEYAEEDRARIENFGRAYNPGLRVALSPDAWAEEGEPLLQDPAG
jgi:hypothetical protein